MTEIKDRFGKLLSGQCYALYYSLETPFRKRFFNKNKACFLNGATVVDVNLSDFLNEQEQKEGVFNLHFEIVDAQEKKVSSVDLEWILVNSKNSFSSYYATQSNRIVLKHLSFTNSPAVFYIKKPFGKTKRYDVVFVSGTDISPYLFIQDFKEDGEKLLFFLQQEEKWYYSYFDTREYGDFFRDSCYKPFIKDKERAEKMGLSVVAEADDVKEIFITGVVPDDSDLFCFRQLTTLKITTPIENQVGLWTFFQVHPVWFHLKKFYVGKISDNNLDNKPIHQLGNNARYVIRAVIDKHFEKLENLEEIKLDAYIRLDPFIKYPDLCRLQKLKTVEGFRTYAVHDHYGFTVEEFERFKKCLPYTRFIN